MSQKNIIPNQIPLELIRAKNFDDIILYALSAFGPIERSSFINNSEKKIYDRMNKNTFQKWAKELRRSNFIEVIKDKDQRVSIYNITLNGQNELIRRLRKYNLDFQTLNEIEQKRIGNYLGQVKNFFKEIKLKKEEIQIEFLKLSNDITHDKLKLYSEDQFNKLILFLVLNHPKFFPKYSISIEDFVEIYNKNPLDPITEIDVKMFLQKVIDEDIFGVKFYKLFFDERELELYFKSNSEFGSFFETTINSELKTLYYHNKLVNTKLSKGDFESLYDVILFKLILKYKMFDEKLEEPLHQLLNEYFKNIRRDIAEKPTLLYSKFREFFFVPLEIPLRQEKFHRKYKHWEEKELELRLKEIEGDILDNPKNPHLYLEKARLLQYYDRDFRGEEYFDKVLDSIEKAIELDPKNSEYYDEKANFLLEYGEHHNAIKAIDKAIELNPEEPDYYIYKSVILAELAYQRDTSEDDIDKILELIDKAIEIDPNNPYYFDQKYASLRQVERLSDSLNALDRAIELTPDDPHLYLEKANVLYSMKNYREALKIIEKVFELVDTPMSGHLIPKALILANLDEKEEALDIIQNIIKSNPNDALNYLVYGEIMLTFKNYDDAIEKYKKVILLNEKSEYKFPTIKAYMHMSKCYKEINQIDLAKENYEKGIKIAEKEERFDLIKKFKKDFPELINL